MNYQDHYGQGRGRKTKQLSDPCATTGNTDETSVKNHHSQLWNRQTHFSTCTGLLLYIMGEQKPWMFSQQLSEMKLENCMMVSPQLFKAFRVLPGPKTLAWRSDQDSSWWEHVASNPRIRDSCHRFHLLVPPPDRSPQSCSRGLRLPSVCGELLHL